MRSPWSQTMQSAPAGATAWQPLAPRVTRGLVSPPPLTARADDSVTLCFKQGFAAPNQKASVEIAWSLTGFRVMITREGTRWVQI